MVGAGRRTGGSMTKRKFPFQMTMFSAVVLALLLIGIFFNRSFQKQELFDGKDPVRLYAKTEIGQEPELDFSNYFADQAYDFQEFTYDLSDCDLKTPGTYELPVYYKGELTECVIELTVGDGDGSGEKKQPVGSSIQEAEEN